jgi:hypothetical protein
VLGDLVGERVLGEQRLDALVAGQELREQPAERGVAVRGSSLAQRLSLQVSRMDDECECVKDRLTSSQHRKPTCRIYNMVYSLIH